MRKLASIQKINSVKQIAGADNICTYGVQGWEVIDSKDKYQVGDVVVYCEPDSWIPHELAPFLSKGKEPRVFEGIKGERLRTARLRGQLSQGLLLPTSVLNFTENKFDDSEIGNDVSERLGIMK